MAAATHTQPGSMFTFGQMFRINREKHNWSQAELAARSRFSVSTISALERDQRAVSDHVIRALTFTLCADN